VASAEVGKVASQLDDVFLDHINDLKTHEGYKIIERHIETEQKRTALAIITQKLDDRETQYRRGFWYGLKFALDAAKQVRELRVAEIESDKKGNKR
jgi:hypothetical protein